MLSNVHPVCISAFVWVQTHIQKWWWPLHFHHWEREIFRLRRDKLPWQHSWTCAWASPDETDICRGWKTSRAHQYWWLQPNNGRVSDRPTATFPHRYRHVTLSQPVAMCSSEGVMSTLGWKREGSSFSLITEPVKSFAAPPAAASLSYVSKCCQRGGLGTALALSPGDLWSLCYPDTPERFGAQNLSPPPHPPHPLFFSLCFCSSKKELTSGDA